MKKKLCLICFSLIILCSGCKLNLNSNSNQNKSEVPTTLINSTSSPNIETDLTKLYSNCKKAVVTILNYASYYDRGLVKTALYGSGSGFIYAADDNYIYLYTNSHVVSVDTGYNQSYYEVVFHDGYRSYGTLAYKNGSEDVAIMKVERENQDIAIAALANSDNVVPGEDVFAIGSPLGLEYANTITGGIVSNIEVEMVTDNDEDGNKTTMYLIQVDASLNPGNSGGPLFNMKGEVVGVNTLKIMNNDSGDDVETFNFAIPINHFVIVANSLAENGSYKRPFIGITVIDILDMTLSERSQYAITVNKGIYIESVTSNGPSSGILKKGTIITKVDGQEVDDMADFSCKLYKYKAGDTINVTTISSTGANEVNHSIVLN